MEIEQIACSKEGVFSVHDIICHDYGRVRIISFHIEVSDQESVVKLHGISEEIENEIGKKTGGMVVVHIDPVNKNHPRYDEIFSAIEKIISSDDRLKSFHELRIIGGYSQRSRVVFDIVIEDDTDEKENLKIVKSVKKKFLKKFPEMKVIIKADPKYSYNICTQ